MSVYMPARAVHAVDARYAVHTILRMLYVSCMLHMAVRACAGQPAYCVHDVCCCMLSCLCCACCMNPMHAVHAVNAGHVVHTVHIVHAVHSLIPL